MSTRAQLKIEKDNTFLSGGSSTRAVTVRNYEDDLIDSCVNKTDDLNANDGYLGVDSNGRVDVTKINDPTPVNKFLRDDGTWAIVNIRTTSVATATTATPNVLTADQYNVTALASAITFAAPAGVALDGQVLILRIKDNGTARAITFNPIYKFNLGISAPTTTVINITLVVFLKWNDNLAAWQCFYTTQASGSSTPALTATQVGFGDGSNLLTGTSNLVFDDSNKRLGINNSTPGFPLDIVSTVSDFIIKTTKGGASGGIYSDGSEIAFGTSSNTPLLFFTSNGSFQFGTFSGLFFIGTGVTFSAGAKLHIKGIGTTTGYNIQCFQSDNSTQIFGLQDDGTVNYKNQYSSSATPAIAAGPAAGTSPTVSVVGTNDTGVITILTGTIGATTGTLATITYSGSFAFPTGSVAIISGNDFNGTSIAAGTLSTDGTTTTFVITLLVAALTSATTYKLNYHVKGY